MQPTMISCPGCGKSVPETIPFCMYCHERIAAKSPTPPPTANQQPVTDRQPEISTCSECYGPKSEKALWCPHCGSIPFWRMVHFMVYWALASIPAAIIFAIVIVGFTLIFGGALKALVPTP